MLHLALPSGGTKGGLKQIVVLHFDQHLLSKPSEEVQAVCTGCDSDEKLKYGSLRVTVPNCCRDGWKPFLRVALGQLSDEGL